VTYEAKADGAASGSVGVTPDSSATGSTPQVAFRDEVEGNESTTGSSGRRRG
jgi:hypothetical protein